MEKTDQLDGFVLVGGDAEAVETGNWITMLVSDEQAKAIVTAIEERKRVIGEAAAARRDVDKQLAELGLLSR